MYSNYYSLALSIIKVIFVLTMLQTANATESDLISFVKNIEQNLDARIGISVIKAQDGTTWGYRDNEPFPMASTAKAFICAYLISKAPNTRKQVVTINEDDILEYAPVSKTLIGKSVTIENLCEITLRTSDNTAINKVLKALGGPTKVTMFLRSIGDKKTRFDRYEPYLNTAIPGDPRDTTTPIDSAKTLKTIMLGDILDNESKNKFEYWLQSNKVGDSLLRSVLPKGWHIADRTGAGGFGTRGIIALVRPQDHQPIIISIYITNTKASMQKRDTAIADIGKYIFSKIKSEYFY